MQCMIKRLGEINIYIWKISSTLQIKILSHKSYLRRELIFKNEIQALIKRLHILDHHYK